MRESEIFNWFPEKSTRTYVYLDVSGRHTDGRQEIERLQGFLAARGHRTPLSGVFCRQTVRAAQTFLRDCVDRTIAVDGICGPHTTRTLQSVEGEIRRRRPPRSGTGVRLVMHTISRKKSDYYTFEAEAMRLETEYKRNFPGDVVRRVLVRDGKQIAAEINACDPGSIVSWDVLSHANAGGIHISTDLATPKAASAERQRRHVEYRVNSSRPQSAKDAMFMEEDMRGMYTSRGTLQLVADYFNQEPTSHAGTLEEIECDRFSSDCYVELHGCRTVNDAAAETDMFVAMLSERLPYDAVVVGHTGSSSPRGQQGYRHGEVGVYRGGCEVHRGRRESLRLPNASTPGHDDERFGSLPTTRSTQRSDGSRNFKTDWPPSGSPPRRCPPRRDPPRTCDPPRTYPPGGGDPPSTYPPGGNGYPPPGGGGYPPGSCDPPGSGTYPPPRDPPRGCDPPRTNPPRQYPPPPRPPRNPPRTNPPRQDPPRGQDPQVPRDRDRDPNDRNPRNPQQPSSQVPWGAILTGAAVVGGLALQHRRERDRDRDRGSNGRQPSAPNNSRGQSPRDAARSLGSLDRGNPLSSAVRGFGFGRR